MANEPKEIAILPGEGHGAIGTPEVWAHEVEFFRERMKISSPAAE
jgi:hypothetical protein